MSDIGAAAGNGRHGATGPPGTSVIPVRYRHGVTGEAARTVHLVPSRRADGGPAARALCGTLLRPVEVELVEPDRGMPCTLCLLNRGSTPCGPAPPPDPVSRPRPIPPRGGPQAPEYPGRPADPAAYRALGWPVTTRGADILLTLGREATALLIPAVLAEPVREILTARRSTPAVLVHPYAPDYQVLLAGERYGVPLPWPNGVHEVTGALPLPPSPTPRGPVIWQQLPPQHALPGCREIDVLAALRTQLSSRTG
jgi:hypothetical protein